MPRIHRTGSRRAAGSGRGGGLRKLLPLLLGLLLAVLLAGLLIALIGGDDSDDKAGSDSGRLAAGGAELLPPPANGLSGQVGETATGQDVVVQSVNGNEGLFVGTSTTDRVYVEWGGDVGENEATRFRPQKGQAGQPDRPAPGRGRGGAQEAQAVLGGQRAGALAGRVSLTPTA